MSLCAQLTSEQLKEIIENEKNTDNSAREVQEQLEDGEVVLDSENTSSVVNAVLNTINNEFEHECLDEAVRLLNARPIRESPDDRVPVHKDSISGLPRTKFLVQQVWAIWLNVRRWVWDADMPGALLADKLSLRKTFTSVAAAMLCKLVTEKVAKGLTLSILWGNTLQEWVILVHNEFPSIVGEERECYPLQRSNLCPAACWRYSWQHPTGIQHWSQLLN